MIRDVSWGLWGHGPRSHQRDTKKEKRERERKREKEKERERKRRKYREKEEKVKEIGDKVQENKKELENCNFRI